MVFEEDVVYLKPNTSPLTLEISCTRLDGQLSSMIRVYDPLLPLVSTLQRLELVMAPYQDHVGKDTWGMPDGFTLAAIQGSGGVVPGPVVLNHLLPWPYRSSFQLSESYYYLSVLSIDRFHSDLQPLLTV